MGRREFLSFVITSLLLLLLHLQYSTQCNSTRDSHAQQQQQSQLRTLQKILARKWAERSHSHQARQRRQSSSSKLPSRSLERHIKTYYFDQILDHFNFYPESYTKFKQMYVVNTAHWGGASGGYPIFVYFGGEWDVDDRDYTGLNPPFAAQFKALVVFLEHRCWGKSMPFGSKEEAYKNASTLGYLSTPQALADYAEIILHIKKTLNATNSPVIVFGCSYAAEMATYFRLKYPHIALGAVASSAPFLEYDGIMKFDTYDIGVTRDFREESETCYQTIRKSWSAFDEVARKKDGLTLLSEQFNSCYELKEVGTLKDFLHNVFASAAQYSYRGPYDYAVSDVCRGIDSSPPGTDVVKKIAAGLMSAFQVDTCYDMTQPSAADLRSDGWIWMVCTDHVYPLGPSSNSDTMFAPFKNQSTLPPRDPDDDTDNRQAARDYAKSCRHLFGVSPRPLWLSVEYGGMEVLDVLKNFCSNIIFANGLRDPYSLGSVMFNLSETVVVLNTRQGSHCLDMEFPREDDPDWLVRQRDSEMRIVREWIDRYNVDKRRSGVGVGVDEVTSGVGLTDVRLIFLAFLMLFFCGLFV